MIGKDLEADWKSVCDYFSKTFGVEDDLESIVYLIGVNELGKGFKNFKKHEKLDVMHIGVCRLLSSYGFYELEGLDADGWPHYKLKEQLPALKPGQQEYLMKQAIIEYYYHSIRE